MRERLHGEHGVYELEPEVRSGGQADVYRATAPDGREVAIKRVRSLKLARWLERERDALRRVQEEDAGASRWLVELLDHGVDEQGRPFLVLPWFEDSLLGWIETAQPDLLRRIEVMEAACKAVIRFQRSLGPDALSEVALHRDIKPDNFLVRGAEDGGLQVVLADLGATRRARFLTVQLNTVIHTPAYSAPEQHLPLAGAAEPQLDVHCLAATLYHVLTGTLPRALEARNLAWRASCTELRHLHQVGERRTRAEDERYAELRESDVSAFLDLERAAALLPEDVVRLRRTIEDELAAAGVTSSPGRIEAVTQPLVEALSRGLEPDPRRRDADGRRLLAACERARGCSRPAGLRGSGRPRSRPGRRPRLRSRWVGRPGAWTGPRIRRPPPSRRQRPAAGRRRGCAARGSWRSPCCSGSPRWPGGRGANRPRSRS